MRQAIPIVRDAFAELSTGKAHVPLRTPLPAEKHEGMTLFMPGYLGGADALACKIVSIYNRNPAQGLPLIHAVVLLMDAATGRFLALMEGNYLTALRTGAASGAATSLLARADSRVAAVFGAGIQGRTQLQAVCVVRPITRAWVYDRVPGAVREYIAEMRDRLDPPVELLAASTPSQAVAEADVICTATTSLTPVFDGVDLKPGAHINGIGSYLPGMQEVDFVTLERASKIVIDSRSGALAEAGDLLQALERNVIRAEDIYGEIGEIAAGLKPGRTGDDEITYFKSVGNAVQDVAVAHALYEAALQMNLGTELDF